MQHIADAVAAMSALEIGATLFAIAYLLLVIKENIWCWPAALISVVLSLVVFYEAKLYMESALQFFYGGMAIFGWYQWRYGGRSHEGIAIQVWTWRRHALVIAAIILTSLLFGTLLRDNTDAAFPFLDSFTTVAAVFTTYMVTKKVLENWVYWFVIDGISVYLYGSRGLFLFAALFIGYLVLVVIGFRAWTRQWHIERAGAGVVSGGF